MKIGRMLGRSKLELVCRWGWRWVRWGVEVGDVVGGGG